MRKIIFFSALAFAFCTSSWAISKLPPEIPIKASGEKVVFSFKAFLDETNDGAIKEIVVCRRLGSRCIERVWDVQFPQGFTEQEMTMFQTYPQAVQREQNPSALYAGGSYTLFVYFHERGKRKMQTVSSTIVGFCLLEDASKLQIQSPRECAERRVREDEGVEKSSSR